MALLCCIQFQKGFVISFSCSLQKAHCSRWHISFSFHETIFSTEHKVVFSTLHDSVLLVGLIILKLLSGNATSTCHTRQRPPDFHKVKTFMQTKRQQSMADRKNQAASAKAEKAKIQENLLALEAFRRKQRSQDGAENEVSGDTIFSSKATFFM